MNDDLGNFPTPPAINPKPTNSDPLPEPKAEAQSYTPPSFEPTPDEIPSPTTATSPEPTTTDSFFPEIDKPIESSVENIEKNIEPPITPEPKFEAPSLEPVMATTVPSHKSPGSSLVTVALLLVGGIGISGSVFLYSQSANLKKQLTDITKTLEQQKTVITPSPTPTIIDIPSPTPTVEISVTPTASPSVTISITPTVTITIPQTIIPLALAPQALKVGINEEPNAQLILIKAENAQDPEKSLIKYYFRKDLTTKKYFYVSINGKNESEINDNAIYVNPDNSIPSLNDLVLGNKLGIDYKEASEIATKLYTLDRPDYAVNAQFIKSGTKTIWQITIDPTDKKYIVQIDSTTKEVLYKTTPK